MKIVLVGLTYPFRGGIAHYTSLLFRELTKRHQVRLVSLKRQYPKILFPGKDQKDHSQERIEVENSPLIHPLTPWSWIYAFFRIRRMLPDLILFQWWHPFFALSFGSIALLLKGWGRGKICFLCHNVRPHESTLFDKLLLRYAFHAPNHFIVHSQPDLIELIRLKPGATVVRTLHPNYGVFRAGSKIQLQEAKRELGIEGNLLLFFGYVRKYKGLEYLLQAFPKVLKQVNCDLLIVGEIYEDKDKYLQMISETPAKDKIHLIDQYVPNEKVALYFTAADLVVLPYVSATQSGIIQIAYAFKKPIVSTRVGGIPEAVVEGETGFLADPQNADSLADAILTFFETKGRKDFSKSIEKVRERFSWERTVEAIEKMMTECKRGEPAEP